DTSLRLPLRSLERAVDPSQLAQSAGVADLVSADLSYTERRKQAIDVIRVDSYTFSMADPRAYQVAELGGVLYAAAGCVLQYAGKRLTEVGFWAPPEFAAPTVSQPGGTANMAVGTYVYALVWEWQDDAGQRHQSAPTLRTVEVNTDNSQVAIAIPS